MTVPPHPQPGRHAEMVEAHGAQDRRGAAHLLAEGDFLRRLAARLVRDQETAADLVQDTWLVALQRSPRSDGSLRPWLGRIIRHLAWKLHRSTERRRRLEQRSARPEATPPAAQLVEELALQRAVRDAVLGLREPYRRVVLLRYLDGLPPRAIAEQLGIPVAAVKTRLKRALARLRRTLADRDGRRGRAHSAWAALLPGRRARAPQPAARFSLAAGMLASVLVVAWLAIGAASGSAPQPSAPRGPGGPALAAAPAEAPAAPVDGAVRAPVTAPAPTEGHAPRAATGSLRVRVLWGQDGPADGVAVRAVAWGGRDPLLHTRRATTGADGSVRFPDLPCGRVVLTADRGGRAVHELETGSEHQVELRVPAGVDIDGVVVAADGAPVAGALVWLAEPRDACEGAFVHATGADGSFALRSVSPTCWLGARASGFAPTEVLEVPAGEPHRSLVLQLREGGGDLEGTVRGPTGEPVAGALVLVGVRPPAERRHEAGLVHKDAPGFAVATDAQGRFRALGLDAGPTSVLIRSSTLAPLATGAVVQPGTAVHLQVTLGAGTALRGTVRNRAGMPVAHAIVGVGHRRFVDAFTSSRETFLAAAMRAGADGRFELHGLPEGALEAWAAAGSGFAQQTLLSQPGAAIDWDPVVEPAECRGRVLDHRGQPLAGWLVDPMVAAPACSTDLPTTDADGRFTLAMRPGAVTAVAIRDPAGGRVCARLPGWPMHDGEVEIVVPEAARPSAFVTGRICDVEGAPLLAARVHALRAGDPAVHGAAVDPGGAFRIGPLPPDVYRLAVEAPGQPGMELATVALAPGAEHAVGTLVLARRNP